MHLTDEVVLALLDGRLPAREAAATHAHTAECAPCRQLVAEAARARQPSIKRAAPVPSRKKLLEETRRLLKERFNVHVSEMSSLIREARDRLDVSISGWLRS